MQILKVYMDRQDNNQKNCFRVRFFNNILRDEITINISDENTAKRIKNFIEKIIVKAKNLDNLKDYSIWSDVQNNSKKKCYRVRYIDIKTKEITIEIKDLDKVIRFKEYINKVVKSIIDNKPINNSLYCINQEVEKCC